MYNGTLIEVKTFDSGSIDYQGHADTSFPPSFPALLQVAGRSKTSSGNLAI